MPCCDSWKLLAGVAVAAAGLSAAARSSHSEPAPAAAQPASAAPAVVEADRSVRDRLQKKVTVKYEKRKLREVIEDLAQQAGVNSWINEFELNEAAVPLDTPIDADLPNVSIETALEFILPDLELTWYVDDSWYGDGQVLHVTTETSASDVMLTRAYDVRRLLRAMKPRPAPDEIAWDETVPIQIGGDGQAPVFGPPPDPLLFRPARTHIQEIVDIVENGTSGPWLNIDGIGGRITPYGTLLFVRQNPRVHDEVAALLDGLTNLATAETPAKPWRPRSPTYPADEDEAVRQALQQRVDVAWEKKPLDAALAEFFNAAGIPYRIDRIALQDEGIAPDEPIDLAQRDIPRRSALELAFEPLGLTWIIDRGFLIITTRITVCERLDTVVYDVRDLLIDGDFRPLIDLLENETPGPWVDIDGVGGNATPFSPGLLVVWQTSENQSEIERLFALLREKDAVASVEKPDAEEVVTRLHQAAAFADGPELVSAIREFVAPGSWEGADGGKLRAVGNALVVRHKRKVQQQIERFLRDMTATSVQGGTGGIGGAGVGFSDSGRNDLMDRAARGKPEINP
ncbi:MAG: hypothetical protein WD069_08395 [Planctomycetales bacterium]